MPALDVHLVEPEREVWAGAAKFVIARSAAGDLGVLPGHEPVLSLLREGPLKIELAEGDELLATVDGGFLSVGRAPDGSTRVDILAEHVAMQGE